MSALTHTHSLSLSHTHVHSYLNGYAHGDAAPVSSGDDMDRTPRYGVSLIINSLSLSCFSLSLSLSLQPPLHLSLNFSL